MAERPPLRDPISGAEVPRAMVPFVEVLGVDDAVQLCLMLGFSRIYVSANPVPGDKLVRDSTLDFARRLATTFPGERVYIPYCRAFLIHYHRARGWKVPELARRLKCSENYIYKVTPVWASNLDLNALPRRRRQRR